MCSRAEVGSGARDADYAPSHEESIWSVTDKCRKSALLGENLLSLRVDWGERVSVAHSQARLWC